MSTFRYPSQSNAYIPQLTGQAISYIRDPKEFKLNKYVQYLESDALVGLYFVINRSDSVRVVSDADYIWADGADRPVQDWHGLRFRTEEFTIKRRNYSFRMGNIAIKAAGKNSWKAKEQHVASIANIAMINRTNRVIDMLETTSNWVRDGENFYESANVLNGGRGKWDEGSDDPSSPKYLAVRRTLQEAGVRIKKRTNGMVGLKDMVLIISPSLAARLGSTPEIHNHTKYGPFSKAQLEDGSFNPNADYGLPPKLYGVELVIEDTVYASTRPNADGTTDTREYSKSDTSAILVSRKGGISGNYGSPSFSTMQLYWYQWEMAVFMHSDAYHEREEGHVVDCFSEVLAAPEAGMLITDVI